MFDPERDGLWTARVDGRIEGSVAIDGSRATAEGAELRWFLVSDALRGLGAGSRLLDAALAFCRSAAFSRVHLWTFAGLDRGRQLYDTAGFVLTEQHPGTCWGTEVLEQRLELDLRSPSALSDVTRCRSVAVGRFRPWCHGVRYKRRFTHG